MHSKTAKPNPKQIQTIISISDAYVSFFAYLYKCTLSSVKF